MILTSLILIPLIGAGLLFYLPQAVARWTAILLSFIYFAWSLSLFYFFDPSSHSIQLSEQLHWIPALGIQYFLGIDGISFWLVLLTSFLFPLTILGSSYSVQKSLKVFLSLLFLLTGMVQGSFLALDGILFYIFFEGSLIPLFFLILVWGGEERLYASFKFLIYTALGSLFMLVGILTLMFLVKEQTGQFSASVLDFYQLQIPFISNYLLSPQSLLFFSFLLAFAIKTPIVPFHTWLPLAHVQAPTAGSIFLAAVVLKMGAYGFLRFILPLFPEASLYYAPVVCFLSVFSIIYGAFMALAQKDLKKLIAYSSVSHMGYITLGFFIFNSYSVSGGFYQMLTHGLSSAALFALVGMIYQRTHTRNIYDYGGLASVMPVYSTVFFLVSLSAMAVPLTGGFISEFLVLFGTFMGHRLWLAFAILGVILGAIYMLFLILKMFFGATGQRVSSVSDLYGLEKMVIFPIVIMIFVTGIFPHSIFKFSNKSLSHLVKNKFHYELSTQKSKKLKKRVQ